MTKVSYSESGKIMRIFDGKKRIIPRWQKKIYREMETKGMI